MDEYVKATTDFGKQVFNNANDTGNTVIVDSLVISEVKLDTNNLKSVNLAALTNSLTFPITDVKSDSEYYYAVATVDNDKVNSGRFTANTLALVGHLINGTDKNVLIVVNDNDPLTMASSDSESFQKAVRFKLSTPVISATNNAAENNAALASVNSLSSATNTYIAQNDYDKTLNDKSVATLSTTTSTIFNQIAADNSVAQSNIAANSATAQSTTDSLKSYIDSKFASLASSNAGK